MKENITIDMKSAMPFLNAEEVLALAQQSVRHIDSLKAGTGEGSDFLGWMTLPVEVSSQLSAIEKCALHLRAVSDCTVIIGIGGSYLGTKAVLESVAHSFAASKAGKKHEIFFAGQNLCEDYMSELMEILESKNYSIIVISKSGTTTEPAVAFRLLRNQLERKVGKAVAADRIIAVTDSTKGALRTLSETNGYDTFIIPDNVGGRYSVLTPVGLLPLAVAGVDIKNLVAGAGAMQHVCMEKLNSASNPALLYAAARNSLLKEGKSVEMLISFTPKLHYFAEWWKQLFGESEGKNGKGIFPASAEFTTDLHSMGQYIQDGQRILFETMISIKNMHSKITIPSEKDDSDELNYLSGKRLSEVNSNAMAGTVLAHNDGGVPVITINVPELNEYYIGQLIYFFEMSCAVSGYILDVNPFDQPGVEAYKKNMFALLNKPGFEEAGKVLRKRI